MFHDYFPWNNYVSSKRVKTKTGKTAAKIHQTENKVYPI